ncbi:nicotinamide mononucleotide transporter [Acinetobacter qingfengensis]|uniref:Nicotinamide riboside transporter PnuC n=1 Tax=Acinetobacter qingfengensis TaxID=1262585 RepID=A0A1E7R369_9GAMM|nr:nicotinamide riboside transporter PnuC [Acinetobacter qingfengensis]KAA8733749.1 nicotinamide mononucleotide transporter [Acinetobacter qingfengensis]OEY93741.1 hypothetical protein BJI46_04675 [Acinetobacter qingfengensis]
MSKLEIAAFILNVLGVWLTAKQYRICWLVNIMAVSLYIVIFYEVKLYSDALLQCIFVVLQIYGWYSWSSQKLSTSSSVSRVPKKIMAISVLAGAGVGGLLGFITHNYTDAALPWLDAALTAFSIVASLWAARKYIESWMLWCVLDAIYVMMFINKNLYLTAFLYFIFILLALNGWRMWNKQLSPHQAFSSEKI